MPSDRPSSAAQDNRQASDIATKVEALENAKRRASVSYSHMSASPHDEQACAATLMDEEDVLRARVSVLNAIMCRPPPKLCLEVEPQGTPRVYATYDRIRLEAGMELGPMQPRMAWGVDDAEHKVLPILHQPSPAAVRTLLRLVRESAPRRKADIQDLHRLLSLQPPALLREAKPTAAGHIQVLEGTGDQGATYRMIHTALDLDILEGWQNPSTNEAIRQSILHTAAAAPKAWSNVTSLQIHIQHGNESHQLTLNPYWNSESCTVSHLQFRQSVFDEFGPERGILNLCQDPASIHPIPQGEVLPLRAYVCLRAHAKGRLREAQLNYVHAQGLLAHGFDVRLLPDANLLQRAHTGRMPPAKATRVSTEKLDVLASSYHIADQVYTTITVVKYPPFGVQFQAIQRGGPQKSLGRGLEAGDDERETEIAPPEDGWEEIHPPLLPYNIDNAGRRKPPEAKRIKNECGLTRKHDPRPWKGLKKDFWDMPLRSGEHYFVDGVWGDPYNILNRFVLFEVNNGLKYKKVQEKMQQVKSDMYTKFGDSVWDPTSSFYENIRKERVISDEWNRQWSDFLKKDYIEVRTQKNPAQMPLAFYYTENPVAWMQVLGVDNASIAMAKEYNALQEKYLKYWETEGQITPQQIPRSRISMLDREIDYVHTLPLPKTLLSARSAVKQQDLTVQLLKSRISALETKLKQTRHDENTQFLLETVIDRLESNRV
jgi:hypothetical protein